MNILHLTTHLNVGGITSYLFTLGRGLIMRRHRVWVASSGGACAERFQKEGIGCIGIPIKTKSEIDPRILASVLKLKKSVRTEGIQIIHAHTRVTQVLGCYLQNVTGIPVITTCHGFFKARFTRRWFPCWGVKTIAVSREVRQHLIDDFKLKEQDIRVIPNGVDSDRFSPVTAAEKQEARTAFGLAGRPVVGSIARLSDVKGHVYLIRAMKTVVAQVPDAQLVIVGEGKEEERLRAEVDNLGLGSAVHFIATVPDTNAALAAMDVFAMPSLQEGLGLGLMEAMAKGLPVVGSGVGGIKSLIRDRERGRLVKPADPDSLAQAIIDLLRDPAGAQALGARAREFIRQDFSENRMTEATEEVYKECLKENGS